MSDQATGLRKLVSKNTRYIVVTSGKGGVGKTNISVNLTLVLAKTGKEVMLFDADLGLSSADLVLGVAPKYSMNDLIEGRKQLSEICVRIAENAVLVPAGSGFERLAEMTDRKFSFIERQLSEIKAPDYIIIDTAAGIGKNVTRFLEASDEAIIVLTPEPSSVTDAYVMIKLLKKREKNNIALVVNMAKNESEAKTVFEHISNISKKFLDFTPSYLGFCPKDQLLSKAVRKRKPIIESFPHSPFSREIVKIAGKISREPIKRKRGFIDFMKHLFAR